MAIAFDNEKYMKIQAEQILKRIEMFGGNKLYLEFGGKLFDDYHASRVLPGFKPDSKIQMLSKIKDKTEFLIVASANDIQSNKIRNDLSITYESEVLRLIESFKTFGLETGSVVISQFETQPNAMTFIRKLKNLGVKVYKHYHIDGYPFNTEFILSEKGFGKNEYVVTSKPLVVVTAPGPGSGKMSTCLSQLYNDHKRGIQSGYAKYETFPIWNLSLHHPVNLAYESATADLNDINMIDQFHLETYNQLAVNYNRDIEVFPVLKSIFENIYGESPYKSPTDMGVNMAGFCIIDEEIAEQASKNEIIRRYLDSVVKVKLGKFNENTENKISSIMKQLNIQVENRRCVLEATKKAKKENVNVMAIQLHDGHIITGKSSKLLRAPAAAILNALKHLAGIDDSLLVLSPLVLDPIISLKLEKLGHANPRLHVDEVLLILAISANTNPIAELLLKQLDNLKYTQAHSTYILSYSDDHTLKKLSVDVTTDPTITNNK